jgi:glycosyltransferase involved in cell wall biosynthesis
MPTYGNSKSHVSIVITVIMVLLLASIIIVAFFASSKTLNPNNTSLSRMMHPTKNALMLIRDFEEKKSARVAEKVLFPFPNSSFLEDHGLLVSCDPFLGGDTRKARSSSVVFILTGNELRNGPVNGRTIRRGTGSSGTDQTTILVAEHLASIGGRRVVIAGPNSGTPGAVINGVTYTNMAFDGVADRTFDVMVNTLWFDDIDSLPIRVTRVYVSWCHCPYIYGFDKVKSYVEKHGLRYAVVHLSEWSRGLNAGTAEALSPGARQVIIPNPIMTDLIREVQKDAAIERIKRSFVFHAEWSRGGQVAYQAASATGWKDAPFTACSYYTPISPGNNNNNNKNLENKAKLIFRGSLGKRDVLTELARAEYFVYPLTLLAGHGGDDDGRVHKDTFACCVAEACAMGAIVLTYPVAALPETYRDCVYWLDFPPGCKDLDHLRTRPLSHDPAMTQTAHITEALLRLDADPALRARLRKRAREWVMENYGVERVGGMWDKFLTEVLEG